LRKAETTAVRSAAVGEKQLQWLQADLKQMKRD
jgi:hypothetical protein